MNLRKRSPLILAILVLSLGLVLPAAASAAEPTVSTSASATVKVRNDAARVFFAVVRERPTRAGALSATSQGLRGVIAAVRAFPGVKAGEVSTGRVSVRKQRHGGLYRAVQGVSVVLHQPRAAGRLIDVAVTAGASTVSGPNFFVSDREAAFAKALGAAFDKAKARAEVLAARAGSTLGAVITIDEGEGPFVIGNESSGEESTSESGGGSLHGPAKGAPPTSPGTSSVSAFVHVVFALVP